MIYRKWSLLIGPPAMLGAIVGTIVVVNLLFVKNDPFVKPDPRKQEKAASAK